MAACSGADGPDAAPSPSLSVPELPAPDDTELPTARFAEGPDRPTQVVYELDTPEGSEEITVAWEGERFALVRSDGRLIRSGPGEVVFCTQGPPPGDDICWALEERGEAFLQRVAADLLAVYGLAELLPDATEDRGTPTIAGREARCVGFSPDVPAEAGTAASPVPVGETTFCHDQETGVGLRLVVEAGEATQTLEATSFGAPDEGLFRPTAEVLPYPSEGAPSPPA